MKSLVAPASRGAEVVDDRVRDVEAAVAGEAEPEREVGVLEVAEVALVEAADPRNASRR